MKKYNTREEWLVSAVKLLGVRLFKPNGYTIPKKVKVSLGWPAGKRGKVLGQAWSPECSDNKFNEIFISPVLCDISSKRGVLAVLVHELIHVTIGNDKGHKAEFKKAMKNLGLEGKASSTYASAGLADMFERFDKELGKFPHAKMSVNSRSPIKKQTTRLIKVECPKCGYIVRVTRTWLDDCGAPICPVDKKQFVEV